MGIERAGVAVTSYHGRARNALARALHPTTPVVRVRPCGRLAWAVVILAALAALLGGVW